MKKLLVISLCVSALSSSSDLEVLKIKCSLIAMYSKRNLASNLIIDRIKDKKFTSEQLVEYHIFLSDIDFENREALKEIIYNHGWLKKSVYGEEACLQSLVIVLNSHQDILFQKYCLELLEKSYKEAEANGEWYAALYDNIAIAEDRPQRHGTQRQSDGKLYVLEDSLDTTVGLSELRQG